MLSHKYQILKFHTQFGPTIDRRDVPGRNPDGTENKFDHAWADSPREGRIGLQDHGDDLRFRDSHVREL